MISSKSRADDRSLGRHYRSLIRASGRLRRVETVKVYTRKRRVVLKREDWELKVAVRSLAVKKACADCRATNTPLWRRGPSGPRTLCNACGIRYRRGLHPKCEQSNESYPSSSSSSSTTTTTDGLSYEELKQRQKEKQMKMLVLLGWNKKKNKDMNKENPIGFGTKSSVAAGSGRKEAEAALLLMSLSSGILVH